MSATKTSTQIGSGGTAIVTCNPTALATGGDCHDEASEVYPGAPDVAGDDIDTDSDGLTDIVEAGLGADPNDPDNRRRRSPRRLRGHRRQ